MSERSVLTSRHVSNFSPPQSMDGDFQTVSLGNWMELPNLKFSDVMAANSSKRVKVSSVAQYYQEYIQR